MYEEEVWYRIAALCALAACPNAGSSLAPLQLCMGVSGGSQIIGHALRADMQAEPNSVTIQLDWKNVTPSAARRCSMQSLPAAPCCYSWQLWPTDSTAGCWSASLEVPPCCPSVACAKGTRLCLSCLRSPFRARSSRSPNFISPSLLLTRTTLSCKASSCADSACALVDELAILPL
jgi:hypothetical protein